MQPAAFQRVSILGTGGFGTALAILLARSGTRVRLWGRDPGFVLSLDRGRRNERHLPGVEIPSEIEITADPQAAAGAELILAAIPSQFLRAALGSLAPHVPPEIPVLSVVKGIEPDSFARPSQIIASTLGDRPVAVLSGPSHAEELARNLPASIVVASADAGLARRIQATLNHGMLRVYTNPDTLGVELAGALKNILGIAAGICDGLGFGDNAKAALLTRGLAEITRFAVAQGARPETFYGLAGVGDVITTCYSPFGRNRAVGHKIGSGMTLAAVLDQMDDVAEGVTTTRSVHALARLNRIEMPITTEVHQILFEGKPPLDALSDLMLRPPKTEAF
jgi:glycerol-3-phosphate dehydrogenase (NAD(P)+)